MARTSKQILQNDYLIARAKIIEVAAVLDRIDRAVSVERNMVVNDDAQGEHSSNESLSIDPTAVYSDPSFKKIRDAILILTGSESEKTRRIQELLSRPFDPNWKQKLAMPQSKNSEMK